MHRLQHLKESYGLFSLTKKGLLHSMHRHKNSAQMQFPL